MINEIIAIYSITDDILKAIGHSKDCRRTMSDAENLITACVAALFFNGNHQKACEYSLIIYSTAQRNLNLHIFPFFNTGIGLICQIQRLLFNSHTQIQPL
jgi:hypothetical protein